MPSRLAQVAARRRKALQISGWGEGVNDKNPILQVAAKTSLKSFHNDVQTWRDFLAPKYLNDDDVTSLIGDENTTSAQVETAFQKLKHGCADAAEPALAWIHYMEHGKKTNTVMRCFRRLPKLPTSRLPASQGDGCDNAAAKKQAAAAAARLTPRPRDQVVHVGKKCAIVDDGLHRWLDFGKTHVFAVFACCHSSTMMDLPHQHTKNVDNVVLVDARATSCEDDFGHRMNSICTCADMEDAQPYALTNALFSELKADPECSIIGTLFPHVQSHVLKATKRKQNTQLCSSFKLSEDVTIFRVWDDTAKKRDNSSQDQVQPQPRIEGLVAKKARLEAMDYLNRIKTEDDLV